MAGQSRRQGGAQINLHYLLQVRQRGLTDLTDLLTHLVIHGLDMSQRTVEDALNAPLIEAAGDRGLTGGPAGLQQGEGAGLTGAEGQVLPGRGREVELVVDGNLFTGLRGSRNTGHRHDVVVTSIQGVHPLLNLHVVKILSLSKEQLQLLYFAATYYNSPEHHPASFVLYFQLQFGGQLAGVHVEHQVQLQLIQPRLAPAGDEFNFFNFLKPPDLDMVEQEYLPTGVEEVKASPHSYCTAGMGKEASPAYSESSE